MKRAGVSTEAKVGILVLVGIILLFYLSFRVSRMEMMRGEIYTALFHNVSGLVVGADVEVAGVLVGRVEKIDLEGGKAKVWMKIGKVKLHQDAEAILRTHGVLGDKFIEVKPGSPQLPELPPGGMIAKTRSAADMDQLFSALKEAAEGLEGVGKTLQEFLGDKELQKATREAIFNLRDATSEFRSLLEENREKVNRTFVQLERFSEDLAPLTKRAEKALRVFEETGRKIERGEGTLGKLITDTSLYEDFKATASNLRSFSEKIARGEGTLGKLLTDSSLYEEMKATVSDLHELAERINRGEGTLGRLLKDDSLYREAERTLKKVRKAAEGIQEQTPITIMGTAAGLFF